jgi:hypothetical protein
MWFGVAELLRNSREHDADKMEKKRDGRGVGKVYF